MTVPAKRLMFVFGTRPEAIKMAPVILHARQRPDLEILVCSTGQHREMLAPVLELFGIAPDFELGLMQVGQTLAGLTSSALVACNSVFAQHRPDIVLVHGDTTTTLAASLAAYYERIPVGHIEAGLRTGDPYSPWPEELNRRLTGGIARIHFSPTEQARANLLREGVSPESIHVTGNTVIDALIWTHERIAANPGLGRSLDERFAFLDPGKRLLLVTGHRRENIGPGFIGICHALGALARRPDVEIVYPVHLNPSVRGPVHEMLGGLPNVHLIEPQDYVPFVRLLSRCHIVLTDSGGIQEEAPALGKPVLVMRDTTERPEALAAGTAKLVGTDPATIIREASKLLDDQGAHQRMARAHNPYGDGGASARIIATLSPETGV